MCRVMSTDSCMLMYCLVTCVVAMDICSVLFSAQEMVDSFSALSRRTDVNQSSQGGVLQCVWQLLDSKAKQHLLLCADTMCMIRRTHATDAVTCTTATNGVIGVSSSQYGSSSASQSSSSSSSKRPTKRARIEHQWDNSTMIINANLSTAATTSNTAGSSTKDTGTSGSTSASITATTVSTSARLSTQRHDVNIQQKQQQQQQHAVARPFTGLMFGYVTMIRIRKQN
jgi:hypothetical protein